MKTVFVVGGDSSVINMFCQAGWLSGDTQTPLDLVCFTGGEDVSPHLYGEANTYSLCNPKRDEREQVVYDMAVRRGIPMVGICRGGQFLNVMNGGKMIQHINGHSYGDREIVTAIRKGGSYVAVGTAVVREDHHQGMLPPEEGYIDELGYDPRDGNHEIIWFGDTKCLCFQPHPEWGHEPTRELFFQLIEEYIG